MLVALRAVIASQKPVTTAHQEVLLVQTSGRIAHRLIVATMGMFEMQLDALRVVEKRSEIVLRMDLRPANADNASLNLRG